MLKEIEIYNYKPFTSPYYRVKKDFYWLQERKNKVIIETKNCKIINENQKNCKIINGFYFFY